MLETIECSGQIRQSGQSIVVKLSLLQNTGSTVSYLVVYMLYILRCGTVLSPLKEQANTINSHINKSGEQR